MSVGECEVDLAARRLFRTGQPVELTAKEREIFEALVQRPGAILSKSQLAERLYTFDADVESNTIEVHISRLRKKLGTGIIETVRGMGYKLEGA